MAAAAAGVVRLEVLPDYGADPVWRDHGVVDLGTLPLTAALVTALRAWAREWEALVGWEVAWYAIVDESAHEVWKQRGRRLAERLRRELGRGYVVAYVPTS